MGHVKIKSYLDSWQVQLSESYKKEKKEDEFLKHSYIYERVKPKSLSYQSNPFNDYKYELLQDISGHPDSHQHSIRQSQNRTIRKIFDYGKTNRWEWFLTFTFNPQNVDSFDFGAVSKKISNWLANQRKKNPDMKYLVVPERHKSGRWHFHGLFSDIPNMTMLDSGHLSDSGDRIFNIKEFKFGFSYAVQCDGSAKVVTYISKYVSKDLIIETENKKRYWVSKNLDLPDVLEYDVEDFNEVLMQFDLSDIYCKSVGGYLNVSYIEIQKSNTSIPQTHQGLSQAREQ